MGEKLFFLHSTVRHCRIRIHKSLVRIRIRTKKSRIPNTDDFAITIRKAVAVCHLACGRVVCTVFKAETIFRTEVLHEALLWALPVRSQQDAPGVGQQLLAVE
jgi:hypothetical protein